MRIIVATRDYPDCLCQWQTLTQAKGMFEYLLIDRKPSISLLILFLKCTNIVGMAQLTNQQL